VITRIDFLGGDWEALETHLLDNGLEQGAFLLAEPVKRKSVLRLLVREVLPVPASRLLAQSGTYLETDPLFFAPILKRARNDRYSVVVVHSHPFSRGSVGFSSIDDRGEGDLIPKIQARVPGLPHAALVVGRGAAAARVYRTGSAFHHPAGIRVLRWPIRDVLSGPAAASQGSLPRYHRQTLAWGSAVQAVLATQRVAVVGAGGIGSHVSQQLLHLGVGSVRVIDPDRVEESNLNRTLGARLEDAMHARPKVEVVREVAASLGREEAVEVVARSVLDQDVALELAEVDFIFGCTDNLASRRLLNRVAAQYLIPYVDAGLDLEMFAEGGLRTGGGRVTVVLPDGPCLHRAEVLGTGPEAERGYVRGSADPAPAVVSFNGVVASLAVSTFLGILGAYSDNDHARQLLYLPLKGRVMQEPLEGLCPDCAVVVGVGDSRSLPWAWEDASLAEPRGS
jgi:molybdopterin/thiamine biosynthesis adenylyltransferase